jgi:hypothetical protein
MINVLVSGEGKTDMKDIRLLRFKAKPYGFQR